jgi:hypothetical protein
MLAEYDEMKAREQRHWNRLGLCLGLIFALIMCAFAYTFSL